jgi:hypothetical protein
MTHSPGAQFACNRTEELKLNTASHTPWQQTGNAFPSLCQWRLAQQQHQRDVYIREKSIGMKGTHEPLPKRRRATATEPALPHMNPHAESAWCVDLHLIFFVFSICGFASSKQCFIGRSLLIPSSSPDEGWNKHLKTDLFHRSLPPLVYSQRTW